MTIYAILSLKGGVGKTSAAMHLAAVAAAEGAQVTVVDADEEASAREWATHAELPFQVIPAERDRLVQQARALDGEGRVVIVDTPPNNRELLTRAGMMARHILVPVIPTGLDVNRLRPTLDLLRDVEAAKGNLDVAILLNRWDGRRRLAREAEGLLEGFPLLSARVRTLARYEETFGTAPSYLEEYRAVWKELNA